MRMLGTIPAAPAVQQVLSPDSRTFDRLTQTGSKIEGSTP
jgi:hypothetical protein